MSGILDVIGGRDSDEDGSVLSLDLSMLLYAVAEGSLSQAAAKTRLESSLGRVLNTDETNDLVSLLGSISAVTGDARRSRAAFLYMAIAFWEVAGDDVPESAFRSLLGI